MSDLKGNYMDGTPKPAWMIKEECELIDKCPDNPVCQYGCEYYHGCYKSEKALGEE